MMKCPKCGGRIQADDKFCMRCGTPIDHKQTMSAKKQADFTNNVINKAQDEEVTVFDAAAEEAKREVSNRRFSKVMAVSCVVAGLAALVVFGTVFMSYGRRQQGEKPPVTTGEEKKPKKPASGPWEVNDLAFERMMEDQDECSLYDHFDVTYAKLTEDQGEALAAEGIDMTAHDTYLYMSDDYRDTVYKLNYTYWDEDNSKSIGIDMDAKSGRIHAVSISADTEKDCETMFMAIAGGLGLTDTEADWKSLVLEKDGQSIEFDGYIAYKHKTLTDCYVMIEANKNHGDYVPGSATDMAETVNEMVSHMSSNKYERTFEVAYEDFMTKEGYSLKELGADLSEPELVFALYNAYSSSEYYGTVSYGSMGNTRCTIDVDSCSRNIKNFSTYTDDLETSIALIGCCLEGTGMSDENVEAAQAKIQKTAENMKNQDNERIELDTCIADISLYSGTYYINIMK